MAAPSQTAIHRLRKELRSINREPPAHITARPLPSNILNWYFVLEGPPGSPYVGGRYLGRLSFPQAYPFKPPAVYMLTPQGRFKIDTKLCLSMSDFHPETWNPLWSVSAVLTGLLTFMLLDEDTVGSITTTTEEKRALARASHTYNRKTKLFVELFPEYLTAPRQPAASAPVRRTRDQVAGSSNVSTQAVGPAGGATGRRLDRANENDKESLPSLIAWLVVFVGVIVYVFRLITH